MRLSFVFFTSLILLFSCKKENQSFARKQILFINAIDSLQIPVNFTGSKLRTAYADKLLVIEGVEGGLFFVSPDNLLPIIQESDSLKKLRAQLLRNKNFYGYTPHKDSIINLGIFFSKKFNRRVLAEVDSSDNIRKEADFFENREDFLGLSEDGRIITRNKEVWYICYFLNKIYQFDKNLFLVKKGKTLDNYTEFARVIKDSSMYRFARPPQMVNNAYFVDEKYLYVNSYIPDMSGDIKEHKKQVIDLYNKKDLQYKGSIYFNKVSKKGIVDFVVSGTYLYALTETYLYQYPVKLK